MPKKRTKKAKTEYQTELKDFRKHSERHVLVLEADVKSHEAYQIFHKADVLRKAGNELTAVMKHNYDQLVRTKRYRKLQKLYGAASESQSSDSGQKREGIANQMAQMQKEYNVTWDFCRTSMIPIKDKYGIDSVFALTKAEDVWSAVEKCLYADGRTIHFAKRGDLSCIRAKQRNRGIVIKVSENEKTAKQSLVFSVFGMKIFPIIKDRFEADEVNAILKYMSEPDVADRKAVDHFKASSSCISTYRPCYASLVCKSIRGRCRVYIHITIEGKALPKYDRLGNRKHKAGTGIIGVDIGTQTAAYTSDTEVGLKNLAERGSAITKNERVERLIYRKMDRSRRAMNPDNYNEDGTIRKGRKVWKNSKHYKRLKARHKELCRINAVNRHLAINEDVNHMRSLGDTLITEPKNAKKLQKRAAKTTVSAKGRYNRKKRFGRSIKNRCPGYFQAQLKQRFESTGGTYIEVPSDYRASQYDHTADKYIKKKLSDRMYKLADGTQVQRDWYSSFLLYCYDMKTQEINKNRCSEMFVKKLDLEHELIHWIKDNKLKVLNSGIKVA